MLCESQVLVTALYPGVTSKFADIGCPYKTFIQQPAESEVVQNTPQGEEMTNTECTVTVEKKHHTETDQNLPE